MNEHPDAAAAAAAWWTERIRPTVFHDNGDRSGDGLIAGGLMGLIADRHPTPSDEQFERFAGHLAESLRAELAEWENRSVSIGCDYGPDRLLAAAADQAEIHLSRFPWKTNMWIDRGIVTISDGYAAPIRLVWAPADWERPPCDTQEWIENPADRFDGHYGTRRCTLPIYHDGDHGDWTDSPLCVHCNRPSRHHYNGDDHTYEAAAHV